MKHYMRAAFLLALVVAVAACGGTTVTVPQIGVDSVSPALGARQGGTPITIKGTNFTEDTVVMLADAPVQNLVFVDSETLTGTTPAAPGGTRAGILVQNANGMAFMLAVFFYIPPPTIENISPDTGSPGGGITVMISGKGFANYDAGPNTVTIGGLPATDVVTMSDTMLTCVNPTGLGPAIVTLTNNNGTATKIGGFRYFPPPSVYSITPNAGSPLGGTAVTVTGDGFKANSPGPNAVTFKGVPATDVVTVDDTTITCTTPSRDGLATVSVMNGNGTGMLVDGFTFYPRPTLSSVSPDTGSQDGGVLMTLTGTGFLANFAGTNTVKVGGVVATGVTVVNDTTITCTTPATTSGLQNVSVSNANGTASLSGVYTTTLSALLGSNGTILYRINTANGNTSAMGSIGYTITAMAFHPDGTLYAVTSSDLIRISTSNGAGSTVATLSQKVTIDDLSFKGTTLYGINKSTGQTYTIDTSNGTVASKYSSYSRYGQHRGGFEYDGSTFRHMPVYTYNYSYGSTTDAGPSLSFDPDTGSRSENGLLYGAHAIMSLGRWQGVMYGVDNAPSSFGNYRLVQINAAFTQATQLGSLPANFTMISGTP